MSEATADDSFDDADDVDFDISMGMLVQSVDDEHTLNEQEELEMRDQQLAELEDLRQDIEIPLDELLAKYYPNHGNASTSTLPEQPPLIDESIGHEYGAVHPESGLRNVMKQFEGNTIKVGKEHQADIPDGLDKSSLGENNTIETMLWDPTVLSTKVVEKYLKKCEEIANNSNKSSEGRVKGMPKGLSVLDNEMALFTLTSCNYDVEEALRRIQLNPWQDSQWTEEETVAFEEGLLFFGKEFQLIQRHRVRTKSIPQLVKFYYFWKKSERHDALAYVQSRQNAKMQRGQSDDDDSSDDDYTDGDDDDLCTLADLLSMPYPGTPLANGAAANTASNAQARQSE